MKPCWRQLVVSLMLLLGLMASPASAQDATIKDIVVTNSSTDLLLFLRVADAFSPEIIEGINNGLVATFNFDIRLVLVREGWPDKEIGSFQLDRTIRFDSLKKEYLLHLSETGSQITSESLSKAENLISELNGVKLVSLKSLQPDREYMVKVRATLEKKTLPFFVNYLLPFTKFWDVNTGWHSVRFRY